MFPAGTTHPISSRDHLSANDPAPEPGREAPWGALSVLAAAVVTALLIVLTGFGEDYSPRAGDDASASSPHAGSDVRYHSAR